LKLTTAKYYTPSGTLIDGVGIEPDIKVDLTSKEIRELHKNMTISNAIDIRTKDQKEPSKDVEENDDEGKFVDVQLSRAIDVLKGIRVYAKTTGSD
jgi:carboxyl-terminal processing protease